jgi:hypothetical protein
MIVMMAGIVVVTLPVTVTVAVAVVVVVPAVRRPMAVSVIVAGISDTG